MVCMDANKDIYKKSIGQALTDPEGLDMSEVTGTCTGQKLGATFFRVTKLINWHLVNKRHPGGRSMCYAR